MGFNALAQVPGSYAPGPGESLAPAAPALLAPDQLENLVAPVALYPDQLLSQILAASTYPLEIVEAQQWLRQNGQLRGAQLADAAKQRDWDPSVQALVIFPDALELLNRDVQWTTALGNAFLAQQADVMDAIQRLRARAQNNGRLRSTPQELVTNQWQRGEGAIEIQPADPPMMYVPLYNPQNVWGPPAQGDYPRVGDSSYGDSSGSSIGQFFGAAVNLASYFTGFGGLPSGAGWGWALNWLTHSVLLNGLFFNMFGFHGGDSYGGGYSSGGGYGTPSVWVHNPGHRGGVPYSNREVAGRFGGGLRTRNVAFASRGGLVSGSPNGGGHYDGSSRANLGGGWRTAGGDRIGSQQAWRSPSNNRSFGNSYAASNFGSAGRGFSSPGYGAGGYGAESNRAGGYGANGYGAGANRAAGYPTSAMSRGNVANGYRSSASIPDWSSRNAASLRASNQHFSEARSKERFSASRGSSQHFSALHFSAPHVSRSHGSGGHSSGGHGSRGHGSGGHSRKH